jgi:hypothetical protein
MQVAERFIGDPSDPLFAVSRSGSTLIRTHGGS